MSNKLGVLIVHVNSYDEEFCTFKKSRPSLCKCDSLGAIHALADSCNHFTNDTSVLIDEVATKKTILEECKRLSQTCNDLFVYFDGVTQPVKDGILGFAPYDVSYETDDSVIIDMDVFRSLLISDANKNIDSTDKNFFIVFNVDENNGLLNLPISISLHTLPKVQYNVHSPIVENYNITAMIGYEQQGHQQFTKNFTTCLTDIYRSSSQRQFENLDTNYSMWLNMVHLQHSTYTRYNYSHPRINMYSSRRQLLFERNIFMKNKNHIRRNMNMI